jgi:hypothetical protein
MNAKHDIVLESFASGLMLPLIEQTEIPCDDAKLTHGKEDIRRRLVNGWSEWSEAGKEAVAVRMARLSLKYPDVSGSSRRS